MSNCNLCGVLHADIEDACKENDLVSQCKKYREMLEDICNDAIYDWGAQETDNEAEALVRVAVIEQARELLGWKPGNEVAKKVYLTGTPMNKKEG